MLTVVGVIVSKGRESALISHVPPESMRHGAEASTGCLFKSILIEWDICCLLCVKERPGKDGLTPIKTA